jgi:hypothetical protein
MVSNGMEILVLNRSSAQQNLKLLNQSVGEVTQSLSNSELTNLLIDLGGTARMLVAVTL